MAAGPRGADGMPPPLGSARSGVMAPPTLGAGFPPPKRAGCPQPQESLVPPRRDTLGADRMPPTRGPLAPARWHRRDRESGVQREDWRNRPLVLTLNS